VQIVPSLFGDWTVMREWGRRGSPGTARMTDYPRRNDAETAGAARSNAACGTATR
jgi:predicted DNA-binding WGR domain protein